MKPSRSLSIYIASSFRNLHAVDLLMRRLRDAGHSVLDWTQFAPPLPANMRPEERRALLDSDSRGQIFDFCTQACAGADLVIYLGQSGQDAACEVGIAWGAGAPVFGLGGPLEVPGLILSRAVSRWFADVDELLRAVETFAEDQPENSGQEEEFPLDLCSQCRKRKAILHNIKGALCLECASDHPWS